MFTIALPKGALLEDSISILKRAGLDFSDALEKNNRSLTFKSKCGRAKTLLVRNGDVPVYVSYGQADLGIVGYDVLRESELKVAKLLDLGFGGCHMSLAVKKNSNYSKPTDLPANCKVASKFLQIYLLLYNSQADQLVLNNCYYSLPPKTYDNPQIPNQVTLRLLIQILVKHHIQRYPNQPGHNLHKQEHLHFLPIKL